MRNQSASNPSMTDYVYNLISSLLTEQNTRGFAAVKDEAHLIVHLYIHSDQTDSLQDASERFCSNLLDKLPHRDLVLISIGKRVMSLEKVCESYTTAILALQHIFYSGF